MVGRISLVAVKKLARQEAAKWQAHWYEITCNGGHYRPFKITQGDRFWYRSKARMRLSFC